MGRVDCPACKARTHYVGVEPCSTCGGTGQLTCTCYRRVDTDGCTEWSCMYHGEENRRKSLAQRVACPVHQQDLKGMDAPDFIGEGFRD